MSSTININRVWQLIAEDWTEKKKLFGYALWITIGLLILVALYWGTHPNRIGLYGGKEITFKFDESYLFNYYNLGFIIIAAFSGIAFRPLHTKEGRISWLIRPGTPLEKLTAVFLVYGIGFLIVYAVLAFGVLKVSLFYIDQVVLPKGGFYIQKIDWKYDNAWNIPSIHLYFAIQAFFILGAFYFKKFSFLKTALIVVLLGIGIFFMLLMKMQDHFGPSAQFLITKLKINPLSDIYSSFSSESMGTVSLVKSYQLGKPIKALLDFILSFIWAPFFWLVSWVRLKETEIQ